MINQKVFYVYAPAFVDWSAGIRVTHYLCHVLNEMGFSAFIVLHGQKSHSELNYGLRTPILTKDLIRMHNNAGVDIVAIYPESIPGNPLRAPYVIRWLLNFPSLLGGSETFRNEKVFSYSKVLAVDYAKKTGLEPEVLYLPALLSSEIEELCSNSLAKKQNYELIYAQKFRALGGTPDLTSPSVREITRFGKFAPNRQETLRLIRDAAVLHAYENTTAITEACLLGTPVVCHKNEYFNELIASNELPFSGISWSKEQIDYPDASGNLEILKRAETDSRNRLQLLFENLKFEKISHKQSQIKLPKRGLITFHSLSRGKKVLTQKGPLVFLRFLINYFVRH